MTADSAPYASSFGSPILNVDVLLSSPAASPTRFIEVSAEPSRVATIPGAFVTGLDIFVGPEGPRTGRQPLPRHDRLAEILTREGVLPGSRIIITLGAATDLSIAARAWVTLRWAGVAEVAVLEPHHIGSVAARAQDLANWARASEALERHSTTKGFSIDSTVIATENDVVSLDQRTVLVDARRPSAFGDTGSHIPGALNLPADLLLTEAGFRSPSAVRAIFQERIGVDPVEQPLILSCGSGISASVQALALAHAGVICPVYIGSWSEWSKRHPVD